MEKIIKSLKNNIIAGVLFLLPVYVLMLIVQKTFGFFAKFGFGMAKFLGLDTVFGKNVANIFGFLLLFSLLFICGFLVRLSFFKQLSDAIDQKLKEYLPGYEKHKEIAKSKLIKIDENEEGVVKNPKTPILFQLNGNWVPAFLKEKNENGEAIVYLAHSILSSQAGFYLTASENIKILNNITAAEWNTLIENNGEGLFEIIKQSK